jgi:ribosomal protein L7Ae-like RNA K-turn-binding protein
VARGTGSVREALRRGEAYLVLLARDASPTQTKKITGILEHRDVPSVAFWTQEELGRALGGQPVSAVALTEPDFAASFLEKLPVDTGPSRGPKTEEEDQRHAG